MQTDNTQTQYKDTGINIDWFIILMFVATLLVSLVAPERQKDMIFYVGIYGGIVIVSLGTFYRQYLRRKKVPTNDAVALQIFGILMIIITDARNLFI